MGTKNAGVCSRGEQSALTATLWGTCCCKLTRKAGRMMPTDPAKLNWKQPQTTTLRIRRGSNRNSLATCGIPGSYWIVLEAVIGPSTDASDANEPRGVADRRTMLALSLNCMQLLRPVRCSEVETNSGSCFNLANRWTRRED